MSGIVRSLWAVVLPKSEMTVHILTKTHTFTVTSNNFLAGGGNSFVAFKGALNKVNGSVDLDLFMQYLQARSNTIVISS
jgi:2',3'-cyclic-nucleotide 2'-phosphodiesterase (5'-nucleotidase family)